MQSTTIDGEKLSSAIKHADKVEASIKESLKTCKDLIAYAKQAQWRGDTRDAFLTYVEILYQYHADFAEASEKQTKALKQLKDNIGKFPENPYVKEVNSI
ncbi:hypothetical protein A374_01409 [Fictibacillus macauensis ZFHKF-1]|uniref:Virulence factor EsxB n=1 Tax=Fictibacillus macauensis ZFHKF-1 TaxID=1196324 RepID=I8UK58_9BACL|nr:WXG100 family type VII secretion target [Fictibacillus macauensis]EIT87213.1 hypothetical protein A374_01409 [Fictibacillus macauensis ZFHKF-1]